MCAMYFEDVKLHQLYRSKDRVVTEKEIIDFASMWDPMPFHLDAEYAKTTQFGGLIASGIHVLAMCHKLWIEWEPPAAVGLGFEEMKFLFPVRPGDTDHMEIEAISKRESKSDPNSGIVRSSVRLVNQNNVPVLSYKAIGLNQKRNKL